MQGKILLVCGPAEAGKARMTKKSGSGNGGSPAANGAAKRATIREVARFAGVSVGTVSRVVNNHPHVSQEIRRKVSDAIRQLGYVPDPVAQSMRLQSSKAIGCMVSDVGNPLFAKMVSAAELVTNAAGYNMVLANSGDDPRREREILALFERRRMDGAIMTLSRDTGAEAAELLAGCSIPLVLIERQSDRDDIDWVASDHHQGLTQAMDYLFSLGHRDIALITVPPTALPGRARLAGYRDSYRRLGIEPPAGLTATSGFTPDYGFSAMQGMLFNAPRPTAVIAGANQMPGVLTALRAAKIDVPGEISVLSLGDTDLAQLFSPPITAVRWNHDRIGRMAAEILLDRIAAKPEEGARHRHFVQPTEIVLRQSCAPARAPAA